MKPLLTCFFSCVILMMTICLETCRNGINQSFHILKLNYKSWYNGGPIIVFNISKDTAVIDRYSFRDLQSDEQERYFGQRQCLVALPDVISIFFDVLHVARLSVYSFLKYQSPTESKVLLFMS